MTPSILTHQEVLYRHIDTLISDEEKKGEPEDSITHQESVDEASNHDAQAVADANKSRCVNKQRSGAETSGNFKVSIAPVTPALKEKGTAKETARDKEKRAARKWLAALGEPEKQNRGPAHAHARTVESPSHGRSGAAEATADPSASAQAQGSQSAPPPRASSGHRPPSGTNASLPDGWTHDGTSYKSPKVMNADGGYISSLSSHPPSAAIEEDYSIPPGEDPDPEACPSCAVLGYSNGRGRCLHTGWKKDTNGVWKGPTSAEAGEKSAIRFPY